MKQKLTQIRKPKGRLPAGRSAVHTLLILALGACLGLVSKWMDTFPELPAFLERLDLTNFMDRLAVWLAIALCVAVFSRSAGWAALNVFVFFAGMVCAYYLYSRLAAGFFPRDYAMIWAALTAASPLFAAVAWYARGRGWAAAVVSGLILGGLAWTTVHMDPTYISITSPLDLVMVLAGAAVLWRKRAIEALTMLGVGILTLLVLQNTLPFAIG